MTTNKYKQVWSPVDTLPAWHRDESLLLLLETRHTLSLVHIVGPKDKLKVASIIFTLTYYQPGGIIANSAESFIGQFG